MWAAHALVLAAWGCSNKKCENNPMRSTNH
ncbi:hypothetical protein ABIB94_007341 [Bradyrhizobium sp. JR7.2]